MSWRESHLTFLNLTLQTFCLSASTCRNYLGELWAICRSYWCAIFIYSFHSDWIWFAYKLLVWCESHCAIRSDGVRSLTWNGLLLAAICKGWLNSIINRNQWVRSFEGRSASLRKTLWASARHGGTCWSYLFHYCLVLNCNRGTIDISASQFKFWRFTLELFIWSESNLTVCVHFELTNIWYFFDRRAIVK